MTFRADPNLTTAEVAERLRVTPETVRNWIRGRRLRACPLLKSYLIPQSSFDAFVRSMKGGR